ncbi:transporter substrate-binding domain-containing protein [Pseudomonas argentinensis]|uniref:Polar amino acid transport system substrate-binding protein n=1 Tax=Phytopseudomonas argentinensis TaxID=289370 RepID=A0A1I3NER5_9GAMM|nr:transporter substrate-binding domain-containing protein [Pseudomonas argentinensis]KAB0550018.1 transporter substrate-binding domain-containing protein [Pseudomonas argentinensis]SFJ07607.1 polar amino acid transport system substrate-binding protein [Pseudomonas argentinensis]
MARGRRFLCTLLMACAMGGATGAQGEPLNIYVGQGQMPFADGVAKRAGLFGELMHELCNRTAQSCVFRSMPWRRVLSEAGNDPHGIVLNLGRTTEREADFVWMLDVLPTPYVLASLDRQFDSLTEALQAGPVAVMAGTPRAAQINRIRTGDQQVVEVTDPQQAAQLLHSGRVVAWYEIDLRALYLWREMDAQPPLRFGKPLSGTHSHIAGSLKLQGAQGLSRQMTAAFEEMRRDRSWQRILASYLGLERSRALLSDGW